MDNGNYGDGDFGAMERGAGAGTAGEPTNVPTGHEGGNYRSAYDAKHEAPDDKLAKEAFDSCETSASIANGACNTLGTDGADPQTGMMMEMLLNQIISSGTQVAAAGKNASKQCKIQADVSKWMTTLNGIKGATCGKMMGSCSTDCTAAAKQYDQLASANSTNGSAQQFREKAREARTKVNQCRGYTMNFMGMMTQSMQHLGNFAVNNQCAKDLAAYEALPKATYTPIAFATPSTSCDDPNNQSLTCFCGRAANAASALCKGFTPNTASSGGSVPTGGTVATGTNPYGGSGAIDDGGAAFDPLAGIQAKQQGSQGGGGPSDGGGSAPGGGLSSLGGSGGGDAGYADPRSAITGTSGGNGGGLGSGGGGGGGLARNNRGEAGAGGFFDKFNLKKFLPGSKYKNRGIAGMSVKSVDGITGPMGPSLWEKATRQYQEQIQKQNVLMDR